MFGFLQAQDHRKEEVWIPQSHRVDGYPHMGWPQQALGPFISHRQRPGTRVSTLGHDLYH